MSRIHEALKKAEQDRAMAPAAAEVGTAPPPQAIEAPMPSWAIDKGDRGDKGKASGVLEAPAQTGILAQPSADYLRYDELISRCAHPVWNPDPRNSSARCVRASIRCATRRTCARS
jgi:hypothetical protein